jgi:hypothetical protein
MQPKPCATKGTYLPEWSCSSERDYVWSGHAVVQKLNLIHVLRVQRRVAQKVPGFAIIFVAIFIVFGLTHGTQHQIVTFGF